MIFIKKYRWMPGLVLGLALLVQPLSGAETRYLTNGQPDVLTLLAPPPLAGSVEQAADLASVAAVHRSAPTNDVAAAKMEGNFSVFAFAPAIGDFFKPGKLPKTERFFLRVRADSDNVVNRGKQYWKRLRPINADPTLNWGVRDSSYSYPSGHSTRGTTYALLLAQVFPEKKDAILAIGREIGWHRIELAVHYPTDIYAGRVLAQALVRKLEADPAFQSDFEAVKAELRAAAK